MADVFEDRRELDAERDRLWALIAETPLLDWLLLTKRPENIGALAPECWASEEDFPSNVWLGTTVEDNRRAEQRIEHLSRWLAPVRFVSYEPALEWVSFKPWEHILNWVIVGGESGPNARYFAETWAAQTIDELRGWRSGGGSVFIKQLGSKWATRSIDTRRAGERRDSHGANPLEWPEHLRVQEVPGDR
jgi:protein gp37